MASLGKTTIIQLVYKNENVVRHFDHRSWIHVSENFNVERFLNEVILLVLDDVWNEDTEIWDRMRKCLREIGGLRGSRILVTTRSERVVSIMQSSSIYQLSILPKDDSWKLFEKIAFGHSVGVVKTLELIDIGRKLLQSVVVFHWQ
ncbi:unnamed protein product [Coffea canephora]|uniref:NB-ARC domain-containing protein n=1 Tax=Coffea canephora TaxID=49390 RepID=A0A068UI08_COFCA|nr:unnamed protein product [Coffea canephora]